ncbi:Fe-S cluster assembly protein SufD [Acaryochloris sp. 'Moss Beach']|uniref:Fe-S cluster assembly protein SufD n=1 Tax=Acaryochloris sp. 'Moss Beach' TaxID=2740837 RepID=UPI001F2E985B|nr:Fe-S cluster assembly protein SufD [Acaryochloris sp. 'Moss Beach']UJB70391.1 Fe-S cluster assembly protein SufD [Acaryochloris sp. 'Moss Beach']
MTVEVNPEAVVPSSSAVQDRQAYLNHLLAQRPSLTGLSEVRDSALSIVQERGLPSNRDEGWQFTDLSGLYKTSFAAPTAASLSLEEIDAFILADAPVRLVFVNGFFAPDLSAVDNLPAGLRVSTLANADSLAELGHQPGMTEVFTALNTASFADGAVLHIAKNQVVEAPIHLLYLTTGDTPIITSPRGLVVAEANSAATLIEEYVAVKAESYFTNAVTEVCLGQNAQIHHHRIQREAKTAFHIGTTAVSQDRDSRYSLTSLSLGGQMSRHNLVVVPTAEQTDTTLNGLTLAVDQQVADTHSDLSFTGPHCTAQQLHKCIVDNRARAVFNGRVFVPKLAQQTNASQLSRNLLLSAKARVDTKPQLEIIADDVKCAHGATVSQLDDEEVFYLQSRGLDRNSACDLLVEGFAAEIIEKLPIAEQRQTLLNAVLSQIR